MRSRKADGFTLIELMMAIVIVAILAAIAYPSYTAQVRESRRAEGQGLLLDTAQALERCRALYGAYNSPNCNVVATITGGNTVLSEEGFYAVSANAGPDNRTFQLQAVPQLADPECETLRIDQFGNKCINLGGADKCLSAGDVDAQECW